MTRIELADHELNQPDFSNFELSLQTKGAIFAAEADCPLRRIHAFCKLLDDVSSYAQGRAGEAAALRREVFRRAISAVRNL